MVRLYLFGIDDLNSCEFSCLCHVDIVKVPRVSNEPVMKKSPHREQLFSARFPPAPEAPKDLGESLVVNLTQGYST